MYSHVADALKTPAIIKLEDNLYLARFECMKIYSALFAVKNLLERKIISKNTTLIDSSSGIYAYSLALACHKFGLKCHIIVSNVVDFSMKLQLELLGARIEGVPSVGSLKLDQNYRIEKVKKLLEENQDYYWMQQYHDDIHYSGYEEFADIVYNEISTKELTVVGGIGSGCSTGGLGSFLRNKGMEVNLCGIQPFGSITFGAEFVEDPDINIAGIGSAIDFRNVKYENYNTIDWISFNYCLVGTIELMKKYAIFAGLSSGASYCVGKYEMRINPDRPCLIIAPDTGHRYLNSVFAKHNIAQSVDNLNPKIINNAIELAIPWCRCHWDNRNKEYLQQFSANNTL